MSGQAALVALGLGPRPATVRCVLFCVASLYGVSPAARTGQGWVVGLGCVVLPLPRCLGRVALAQGLFLNGIQGAGMVP